MAIKAARLQWEGDAVLAEISDQVESAGNATLSDARDVCIQIAPVDTGNMVSDMEYQGMSKQGTQWRGAFGTWHVPYTIFVNSGTIYMSGQFFLERAAQATFPSLAGKLKAI